MAGTRWVRLDVGYFRNPKTLAAGLHGRALHLSSLCWSADVLSDGHLPSDVVPHLGSAAGLDTRQRRAAIDRVVTAGLWVPNGVGYEIHDYLEMNVSRAEAEAEREAWRIRQQRHRNQLGRFDVTP